ncbi:MAG: iron-sulfur cluster assembly scaffold protein [Sphingomonas sp.]|jgi:NifU-like protein involved in Fe-S cluster formation|uniref:iron-sulfur cluster assembly scaffold protein n=1 Tax=Sphingomonas sp. TaxID=28214 RepID=UPI00356973C4
MNAPLYNAEVLRLATSNPCDTRLTDPMGSAERRSVLCGSRITVDVDLDDAGRVGAIGMQVSACAYGQASATLLARHAVGRSASELTAARDAIAHWLAGEGAIPDWPGLAALAGVVPYSARHGAVRLPFEAAADAVNAAIAPAA